MNEGMSTKHVARPWGTARAHSGQATVAVATTTRVTFTPGGNSPYVIYSVGQM